MRDVTKSESCTRLSDAGIPSVQIVGQQLEGTIIKGDGFHTLFQNYARRPVHLVKGEVQS